MPTNLPVEAKVKWAKYLEARTPEEKLRALQDFLSSVPKHKGTENLRAWVRRKIAELRREIEEKRLRRAGRGGPSFFIEKKGAAQVVILGFTNSGKSSLLRTLTNARPEVSDVPFTTKTPTPGMLVFEDIQFQLVEAPAIVENASRGAISWGPSTLGLARNADMLMIILDLSNDPIKQLKVILKELEEVGIVIKKPRGYVRIMRSKAIQGIRIIAYGKLINASVTDVRKLLESYGIRNAIVKIFGEATLDDVEKAIFEGVSYKPSIIILNKADVVGIEEARKVRHEVEELLGGEVPVIVVSTKLGLGIKEIPKLIFESSGIIRVYTKEPNSPKPSPEPLILPKGATVEDAILKIREEFLRYFKYARIWGPSAKYPGERVGLDHKLMDGDVIEIRTKIRGI